jgi:tryptophan-rich sensory protein
MGIGWLGGIATESSLVVWYSHLRRPPLNPPSWVFAPVWTTLYLMMAVAGWRLWGCPSAHNGRLRALFVLQLTLNALWSPLFFGLRNPLAGLLDIVLLWVCLTALVRQLWREDKVSGALLIPYILWVSFATYLNAAIWWLNR